ncbi:hypothetical protein DV736_g4345, partial [Chaetothyriales sp. CBS 134916]
MTSADRPSSGIQNPPDDKTIPSSSPKAKGSKNIDEEENTANAESHSVDEQSISVQDEAWGKLGKLYLWIGVVLMWTVFELDHTTMYNYQNYAASEFRQISALGVISAAGTLVQAVMKPPIAKISDIAGRAETYCAVVLFFIISYALCASSNRFAQYAGGYIIYSIGVTGMQILNQVIVADVTSSRWRGLANGLATLPFLVVPWVSAFISESAIDTIGWRWGIGILAIVLPICSLSVIAPVFIFQRRMTKIGETLQHKTSIHDFFSKVDFGGLMLLTGGFALLLLPLAIAGNLPHGWRAPWVPAVMAAGGVCLAILVYYESRIAKHPAIPPRFLRNISILLAWSMGLLDAFAFNVTHAYMYAWATVVHDFSARNATFLTYSAGCMQVLTGILTGYIMFKSQRYKWVLVIGVAVRLVGYGVMIRLRGANNSIAELFIVQLIQGMGSGVVGAVIIVVAQIVVKREELAQSTALELLFIYLGQALGSAVAGAIYTGVFKTDLRHYLGDSVPSETIDSIYNSITEASRFSGHEKAAVNHAYSNVLRYMTIAAIAASGPPMIMCGIGHTASDPSTDDAKKRNGQPGVRASPRKRFLETNQSKSDVNVDDTYESRRPIHFLAESASNKLNLALMIVSSNTIV